MNLYEYAEEELNRYFSNDEMDQLMKKNILEIVKVFSDQGHSGFSAPMVINILNRLLRYKPLYPLTGQDDEWEEIDGGKFQNKRAFNVFKDKDGSCYNVKGIIFSDDNGETWFTNHDSRVPVTFPYNVPDKPERVILNKE